MKIKKIIILLLILIIMVMLKENLLAQSSQTFKNVKVDKDEKKYASSLLLEDTDINEIIKVLQEHTGAEIKIMKPPNKNSKLIVEFHFADRKAAHSLVWYGKKATVKTYVTKDDNIKDHEINIVRKERKGPGSKINITLGKRISVEYINIRLEELLERFSELGKMKFKLANELKKKNIRVNITMKNFTPEEAIRALANMENLSIKKLGDDVFLITQKN